MFIISGSAISWKVTLQAIVALSATEAKYMAVTEAVNEALWLRGLLGRLGLEQGTMFCDSQSAIYLTQNLIYHERSKHIDVRCHFVSDIISQKLVEVKKVGIVDNPADMMTKPIPVVKFKYCLDLIRVRSCWSSIGAFGEGVAERGLLHGC